MPPFSKIVMKMHNPLLPPSPCIITSVPLTKVPFAFPVSVLQLLLAFVWGIYHNKVSSLHFSSPIKINYDQPDYSGSNWAAERSQCNLDLAPKTIMIQAMDISSNGERYLTSVKGCEKTCWVFTLITQETCCAVGITTNARIEHTLWENMRRRFGSLFDDVEGVCVWLAAACHEASDAPVMHSLCRERETFERFCWTWAAETGLVIGGDFDWMFSSNWGAFDSAGELEPGRTKMLPERKNQAANSPQA
ncbi:hypothetical protein C8Q75DRAFT_737292 [Abortiporus biennis]|nr:hypothetical protein C8Q75DRAFT_737292 [Abortiporus biennis]